MNFKVFNIPVKVEFFFWLIMLMLGSGYIGGDITKGFIWMAVAFSGILMHELGHALWARHYGAKPEIALQGFGGLTSYSGHIRFTRKQDLIITAAGPVTGLLLSLIFFLLFLALGPSLGYYGKEFLIIGTFVNLVWSLFNLLPVLPMDGGHIMQTLIHMKKPMERRIPLQISMVVAIVVGLFAITINQIFITLFFAYFAWMNKRELDHTK